MKKESKDSSEKLFGIVKELTQDILTMITHRLSEETVPPESVLLIIMSCSHQMIDFCLQGLVLTPERLDTFEKNQLEIVQHLFQRKRQKMSA